MRCRHCRSAVTLPFIDLGTAPCANAFLTEAELSAPETWYPLRVLVCEDCWLVQTEDYARSTELFAAEYAYFSSFSSSWLRHAKTFVEEASSRFGLGASSLVIEVAANDGYLLQYVQERAIPCYGIEPTRGTAAAARARGIEIVEDFFGRRLARELISNRGLADLMVANNVLAHVPDINDFVAGFAVLLKPTGIATFEFPHLLRLVAECQFDTIYHEHFSYLSLTVVERLFEANGLTIFDVEEHPTHGGSLRVYCQRSDTAQFARRWQVDEILKREEREGVKSSSYYGDLQDRACQVKHDFLSFLLKARQDGRKVAAYGAAAKGNTLVNFAGIRSDLISFVVDRNTAKQGKYLPGSRIPVVTEQMLTDTRPDWIVIFPWNLRDEITKQLHYCRAWGADFHCVLPRRAVRSV